MASKKPDISVFDLINDKFGNEAIRQLADAKPTRYEVISTGSIGLDVALGIGGLPRGRIVEIIGPEAAGKTTLCLHIMANAQKIGLKVAYIDAEHAMDLGYASQLGVDVGSMYLMQPDTGEQGLEATSMMAASGQVGLIVVDSVAALTPKKELDGEIGDSHVGLQARMMGSALRSMVGPASKTNTMVVFVNQIRHKIGVTWGSNETTPGGRALAYAASVRLDIRRVAGVKKGDAVVANRSRVKVKKNKCAKPFTEAEFDIQFGTGIDRAKEAIELGVPAGVVEKAATTFLFNGDKLGVGLARASDALRGNPELLEKVIVALIAESTNVSTGLERLKPQTSSASAAVKGLLKRSKK